MGPGSKHLENHPPGSAQIMPIWWAQQELAIYCLDTSALLFMADQYPADTFANVWEALSEMAGSGIVVAAREVRRELEVKDSNGAYAWGQGQQESVPSVERSPNHLG